MIARLMLWALPGLFVAGLAVRFISYAGGLLSAAFNMGVN